MAILPYWQRPTAGSRPLSRPPLRTSPRTAAGEDLLPVGDVCPEVAVVHVPVVEVKRVEDPPQHLHADRAERDDGEKLPGAELLAAEDALGGSHEEVVVLDLCNVRLSF